MAQGRFVSRSISTNEQLADVSIEAALLFSWCISHLDVEGRMPADAGWIKANVVPMRDEITLKKIPKLLRELAESLDAAGVSLVVWYQAGRQEALAFPGFAGQQQGLRKEREAPSRLPELTPSARIILGVPPAALRSNSGSDSRTGSRSKSRSNSGVTPAQGEVEVEVEVQGEEKSKNNKIKSLVAADASTPGVPPGVIPQLPPPNWVARLTEHFQREVGHVAHGHLGKLLKPYVERESVAILETAITYYAMDRRAAGKPGKFTWFVEDIATWIDGAKTEIVDEAGNITPFGQRITRPGSMNGAPR